MKTLNKQEFKDFLESLDFVDTKKDCTVTDEEKEEIQKRFGNIHYQSAIVALKYASSGT